MSSQIDPSSTARQPAARRKSGKMSEFSDNASALGGLFGLVWHRKLWWMVPLVVALILLGLLLLVEATPVGPLLYPVF